MHRRIFSVALTTLLLAAPLVLSAQLSTGVSIAAGVALPEGEDHSDINTGYNAAVGLNIGAPLIPVGVRLEGAYNSFDAKKSSLTPGYSAKSSIISATANATVGLGLPYLIGGLGWYRSNTKVTGPATVSESDNALGFNVGAGVRFPLGVMSTFLEARYHKMSGDKTKGGDASFIPITFGIQF